MTRSGRGIVPESLADRTGDNGYWLTQAMARTSGVSLSEALATDRLSREVFADMVVRCAACTRTDDCLLHLAAPETVQTPGYCLNSELIGALAGKDGITQPR